jgi:hypothetical protein
MKASNGLFHCSIHILQLLKTNMPPVTRWQSHIHQESTTHVNPYGNSCEAVVMVKMDGLHAQWSYVEASKGLFHCSTHILQLLKTNMPPITR